MLKERYGIEYNPDHHQIRYGGHIVHLSANAFLFGDLPNTLNEHNNPEAVARSVLLPNQLKIELWRKKGALGKCHNFAHLVSGSPQLVQKWKKISPQMLPKDNATQWSSFKVMIALFLKLRWCYEK